MSTRTMKDDDIDVNHDVSLLADALDELLKSYGNKAKDEGDSARLKAESLLKETRAKLNGHNRVTQAAREATDQVTSYVYDKPWHSVGIGTAVGIVIGALLAARR